MKYYFSAILLLNLFSLNAQQTVGLFNYTEDAMEGYTLFAPNVFNTTYLIDNCGKEVNRWESDSPPGLSVYLLEDGTLLRAGRSEMNFFNAGGKGGIIERFDWENNLLWQYEYAGPEFMQHHDIEYLPNGNILILAWEIYTEEQALQAGRDPALLGANLWSEHILEVEPVGTNEVNVVWEWHLWDHLIQEFDPEQDNYGVVAEHPELMDLNFAFGDNRDWIHLNAIAYNAELDQIALSSRNLSEVWIIDHSTTTEEAAGHTGGQSGKGGDLLYRWGNPTTYQQDEPGSKKLFSQHDVNWIPEGYPGEGQLMVFNNGNQRPDSDDYSSVVTFQPPLEANGLYTYLPNTAYGPADYAWEFVAENPTDLMAANISGARRLLNGNTLICEGTEGHFLEVKLDGEIVWEYISPITITGPVPQGTQVMGPLGSANTVFRVSRYLPDYPGFTGRSLLPGAPLELEPFPSICVVLSDDEVILDEVDYLKIYPNPADAEVVVSFLQQDNFENCFFELYSLAGQKIKSVPLAGRHDLRIKLDGLQPGLYLAKLTGDGVAHTAKLLLK